MRYNTLDLVTFVGFIALVVGVSLYMSRKKETDEGYFLAGRTLSWWVIGLSLIASNISSEHFVGQAGQGFREGVGLAIASWEWIAVFALVITALFLLPRFLRMGIYTMPEFLEYRYDRRSRTFMSVCMLVFYVGVTIATVLYSGALALESIFGLDLRMGIWGIGLLAGFYTFYGGLKAVVWSDVLQGTALLLGGALVTFLGMQEIGGWGEFVARSEGRLHTVLPLDHPELPWLAVFFGGMWLPNLFYWGLNQFITQRTLGARSIEEGQKGVLFGATLKLIIPFIVVFPGILAFELYADEIANPDQAFPVLISKLLPAGLVGVMLAALFGAVMSTLDSLLNSAATIFTIDIYRPFLNPAADSARVVRVGKITTLVLVVLACLWAPVVATHEKGLYLFIQQYWGFLQSGVVAAFFLGLLWDKVPAGAAFWGMVLNFPLYGFLLWLNPPDEFPFLHNMALTFAGVVLFMVVYTLLRPMRNPRTLPERNPTPYRTTPLVKYWSIALCIATLALYMIFF